MPRNIPASFSSEKNKLYQGNPWIILMELQVDATQSFYLTNSLQSVTSNADVYDPYVIELDTISNNSADELFTGTVTVSNITRQIMAFIEADAGLSGRDLIIQLVNLANPNDTITEEYKIRQTIVTNETITFEISYVSLEEAEFPGSFVSRNACRWEFGSTDCGLDTTNVALYNPPTDSTCTKRLNGTYGCIFWGDREVADSLARQHPQRFGAFPSLPAGLRLIKEGFNV